MTDHGVWLWMGFMVLFLVAPMSYGWAYRGWGPPFPRFVQRQRVASGLPFAGRAPHHHCSWGVGGDLIWVALMIAMIGSLGVLRTR